MAVLQALHQLTGFSSVPRRYDDDCVDRLHHHFSAIAFVGFSAIVTAYQNVLDPITCLAPAQFTSEWVEYTNKICWLSNTYYVPMDKLLPAPHEPRDLRIAYYQWVPVVCLIQAFFFVAPNLIWTTFQSRVGLNINEIVSALNGIELGTTDVRQKTVRFIARKLDRALRFQCERRSDSVAAGKQTTAKPGRHRGCYLTGLYLFVKKLYVLNCSLQVYLLNAFLGPEYFMYGFRFLRDIMAGRNWEALHLFPRITMCDFDIRALGNQRQGHTVQCVLPINLFNEKIYLFVWFWLAFLLVATVVSIILWLCSLFRQNQISYVRRHVKIERYDPDCISQAPYVQFWDNYLGRDGVFVLRLVAKNSNDLVVGEILQELWQHYRKRCESTQPRLNVV